MASLTNSSNCLVWQCKKKLRKSKVFTRYLMAKNVNVERQIGLKTAFAHLFDHDRFHFFKAMNTNVSLTSEPYVSILHTGRERSALAKPPFQTHLLAFIKSVNSLIVNLYNRTAVVKRIENQRALSRRCKQLSGCLRDMSTQIYTWHIHVSEIPSEGNLCYAIRR